METQMSLFVSVYPIMYKLLFEWLWNCSSQSASFSGLTSWLFSPITSQPFLPCCCGSSFPSQSRASVKDWRPHRGLALVQTYSSSSYKTKHVTSRMKYINKYSLIRRNISWCTPRDCKRCLFFPLLWRSSWKPFSALCVYVFLYMSVYMCVLVSVYVTVCRVWSSEAQLQTQFTGNMFLSVHYKHFMESFNSNTCIDSNLMKDHKAETVSSVVTSLLFAIHNLFLKNVYCETLNKFLCKSLSWSQLIVHKTDRKPGEILRELMKSPNCHKPAHKLSPSVGDLSPRTTRLQMAQTSTPRSVVSCSDITPHVWHRWKQDQGHC